VSFEAVVERCLREGLVGGDGFAVDASLIAADANKHRSLPSSEWKTADIGPDACRAAREYLATLDDAAFGAASDSIPKFVSPSDPAQWTGRDADVSRQQVRLRRLPAKAALLSERRHGKSRVRSTKALATWRATSRRRTPT